MNSIIEAPSSTRTVNPINVDLAAVKARQREVWSSGDFSIIGTTLDLVGETLCEAADLRSGSHVLDVACGNGNAALAAAHRFAKVVGLDYVPALLERARERAAAERLQIDFVEGDAEALPFPAESFDTVMSTFGVMFTPDQARAAREMTRVVRRGGTIALASWTPEGFIGRLLATVGRHVPPPAGVPSPIYWGHEARLRELFPDVRAFHTRRRNFVFRYESADHFIHVFRTFYGPTHKAFERLDPDGQLRLADDIRALIEQFNGPSTVKSIAVPAEYLETVIDR